MSFYTDLCILCNKLLWLMYLAGHETVWSDGTVHYTPWIGWWESAADVTHPSDDFVPAVCWQHCLVAFLLNWQTLCILWQAFFARLCWQGLFFFTINEINITKFFSLIVYCCKYHHHHHHHRVFVVCHLYENQNSGALHRHLTVQKD